MMALGAVLYHDVELVAEPRPIEAMLDALFADRSGLVQFGVPLAPVKGRPGPYRKARLLERIRAGELFSALVETAPGAPDDERMIAGFVLVPPTVAARENRAGYRFRVDIAVGATALRQRSVEAVVAAIVELAGALRPQAGVVFPAASTSYAHALASGARGGLTPEQDAVVLAIADATHELGGRIRGPEWGTFLSAAHVATLGGLDQLRTDAACELTLPLAGGGAYLQLTRAWPSSDDPANVARLVALAKVLAPVR
jgi:hypothetical protein